jgi:hypothetical protein
LPVFVITCRRLLPGEYDYAIGIAVSATGLGRGTSVQLLENTEITFKYNAL